MEPTLANKVHKMAEFIGEWHGPNFLKCGLASTAPANDLTYFYDMQNLSEIEDPTSLELASMSVTLFRDTPLT